MTIPYEAEAILLGAVLRFGRDAALSVIPQLTPDKFIHDFGGKLGGNDNRALWTAITEIVLIDRADPILTSGALRLKIDERLMPLAEGYANEIMYNYRIDRADPETLRSYARYVHRNGIIYHVVQISERLSILRDPDQFAAYVDKVDDPDVWQSKLLERIHAAGGEENHDGYRPISEIAEESIVMLDQQWNGEQTYLLPVGVPMLYDAGLPPTDSMILVHGISSGGKSTLVHNVFNLGTAIGMVANRISGTVAINSLEMGKHNVLNRMAASLAGFDTHKLATRRQEVKEEDYLRFKDYIRFVGQLPIWMDDTPHINIDTLKLRLAGIHLGPLGPVRQLSTDYLELFEESQDEKNTEQQLGALAAKHFAIKREFGACVIAVSQSTYTNKTFVAGMMGARYSRALTHKPDIVIELVNYAALKKSGTDYMIAQDLDEEHVWVLLQKYRGGPTDVKMAFGWEPEHTRMYDPSLLTNNANIVLFDHLAYVRKLLSEHPTTRVIPLNDTPLAELDLPGDF